MMKIKRVMRARAGFSLVEVLIAMTIAAIIATSLTSVLLKQSRFYQQQDSARSARSVARAALNLVLSDLRMVEAPGGIVSAANRSIVVRVPYALGIVCASSAANTTASLLPVDSMMYNAPGFSGFAVRDTLGAYAYVEAGVTLGAGATATCTDLIPPITTLTAAGGRVVLLTPGIAGALPGQPIFLVRRIAYEFKASTALPGRMGLWRTMVTPNTAEELVAPFDSTVAKFRFFVVNRDTAQDAVPVPITNMRGVELVFAGQSERAPANTPVSARMTTAVFFKNRAD